MRADLRAEAAVGFLRDLVIVLLMIAGGVWALLTYLEPCAAATTLCGGLPLIRQPRTSSAPRWWQRLRLRLDLLRLRARRSAIEQDAQFLQRELTLTRNLLDECQSEADEVGDQIAWACSDLAKLEATR